MPASYTANGGMAGWAMPATKLGFGGWHSPNRM